MLSFVYAFWSVIFIMQSNMPVIESILCYKCTIVAPPSYHNLTKRLCSDFDGSDHFMVDCPYSTFCMKKMYTVKLKTKLVNGTARDCASQMNVFQDFEDGRWQRKISIDEPYEEGCTESNDKGQLYSRIKYCYCKGDFCNSSYKLDNTISVNIIAVMIVYVIFKLQNTNF